MNKIIPCLWFDTEGEAAARFYTSIFKNSKIGAMTYYGKEGFEHHRKPEGSVMTVEFEINGQSFTALNGGPLFKFNEAISFQVDCKDQAEVDYFWEKLSEGGEKGPCGWLKDKFGVSWQIIPSILTKYMTEGDPARKSRVLNAMFQMSKIEIAELERAYKG